MILIFWQILRLSKVWMDVFLQIHIFSGFHLEKQFGLFVRRDCRLSPFVCATDCVSADHLCACLFEKSFAISPFFFLGKLEIPLLKILLGCLQR